MAAEQEGAPSDTAGHPEPGQVDRETEVERALAVAVQLAAEAGQWDVVALLGRELGERRRARLAPAVSSLSDIRAAKRKRTE